MNAPERFNVWRWEDEDSAKRLIYTPDTKVPNAGTFILGKEDHTIGNLMRM
jgi:DNA-directed RNA polymerase II subunit RPB11